jgi:hypothetical protein
MRRGGKPASAQALIRANVPQFSGASARALAWVAAEDESVHALRETTGESLHAMRSLRLPACRFAFPISPPAPVSSGELESPAVCPRARLGFLSPALLASAPAASGRARPEDDPEHAARSDSDLSQGNPEGCSS